jgi:hypothetical protein
VLALCARSGLAKVGVIAVDGTKVQANASRNENLDYEQLAREIFEEAKAVDAAEDELYGEARGDELPPEFATAQSRRGWLREAKQRLEAERAANPPPVPRSRPKRLREAKRRLEEELWTELRANRAYEAYRARGRMKDGRRFGRPPDPYQPPATPEGRVNVTDPDSRVVKGLRGFLQGYNAQAVTNEHQVVRSWLRFAAAELAAVLGLPVGAPGEVGLVVGLLLGLLHLELLLAAPQPLAARPRVGQIGRQRVAEPLVIFGVGVGRLLENPLDLLADRAIALGRLPGGVGGDQAAIDRDEPDRHPSGARAEHKHVGEQVRQRRLCATASVAARRRL